MCAENCYAAAVRTWQDDTFGKRDDNYSIRNGSLRGKGYPQYKWYGNKQATKYTKIIKWTGSQREPIRIHYFAFVSVCRRA